MPEGEAEPDAEAGEPEEGGDAEGTPEAEGDAEASEDSGDGAIEESEGGDADGLRECEEGEDPYEVIIQMACHCSLKQKIVSWANYIPHSSSAFVFYE